MRKLFVSYARENKPDVDQLVEHLRTMGYDTWVDAALRGGQDWWDEILDRIADTDVVIAIYSSAVLNSTACGREFEWAIALGKPVIPVAVEPPPTALPRRFARRQIIDYSHPAQRDRAALQLQGALAAVPPAPPLPDQLPEPPAAPLSYLTDLIDLITETGAIDHDQQHQILRQLEPALTSFDPLERQGGRDILERFSRRSDLYADVDRAITWLRHLSGQPAPAHGEPSSQTTASTAEPPGVGLDTAPADLAAQGSDTSAQDAVEPIGATSAPPLSSPASTPQPELTQGDQPALETDDVAADLARASARGADADTREKTTEDTPIGGSDAQASVRAADEPARGLKPFAQSDEKPKEVDTGRTLFQRLSRRSAAEVIFGQHLPKVLRRLQQARTRTQVVVLTVTVLVVVVVAVGANLLTGSLRTWAATKRLLSTLPAGSGFSNCTPVDSDIWGVSNNGWGAITGVYCGRSSAPGGPTSTDFWLFDTDSLTRGFNALAAFHEAGSCPGPAQSWRDGQVACGTAVVWTSQNSSYVAAAIGASYDWFVQNVGR